MPPIILLLAAQQNPGNNWEKMGHTWLFDINKVKKPGMTPLHVILVVRCLVGRCRW
jgi:hypothetical protein